LLQRAFAKPLWSNSTPQKTEKTHELGEFAGNCGRFSRNATVGPRYTPAIHLDRLTPDISLNF
jgi:hypothetical protein